MSDIHIEYTIHNTIPHTSRSHRTPAETIFSTPNFFLLFPFFRIKAKSTLVIYLIVLSFYLEIDLIPSELSVTTLFLENQLI